MCKFHKDVARDIATDPVTGKFDAGKFCVALLAMAKYRIEQYMPAMHGCDGFTPAAMTTDTAQQALESSGLQSSINEGQAFRDAHIAGLHHAINATAQSYDLSMQALNNRDDITAEGYQHCPKMGRHINQAGPFMDEAVVQLFNGYDDEAKTWARGDLSLLSAAHKPEFEAIRAAADHFLSQSGVEPTLHRMFEHSLFRIFEEARVSPDAPGVKTDGCVMCGHGGRSVEAETAPAAIAETPDTTRTPLPTNRLQRIFTGCASCASAGGGTVLGVMASHIPCVAIPVIAGATGVALGSAFMTAAMLVISPVVAVAATIDIDKWRGHSTTKTKAGIAATLALAGAFGASVLTHHDHHHESMPGMSPTTNCCGSSCATLSMQRH